MLSPIAKSCLLIFFVAIVCLTSCRNAVEYRDEIYQKPTINHDPEIINLSPEETLKRIYIPEGYRIEVVASEPLIREPVAIAWDAKGRMFVAQMVTYMQDIDATNENEPWSRISILEDTTGDGVMDKSTVFIDSMVLPRIMLPLDDRLIVGETYDRSLYSYRDTNGDGKADEKILLLKDTVRDNRNLEHQDASMIWSIDNWLYLTNKTFRYRFTDNKLVVDTLNEPMRGQWGLTQDETGRLFFSRASSETPALGFQQHPVYGALEMQGKWEDSFMEPWPLIGSLDAQGGYIRMREGDSTLNKFTAVAGQEIFLGDKMPGAYGDLFIPEPVGRLIRRAKVNHIDGKIVLENRYQQAEFIASTDPLFRPVFTATGPDGCLYVVDMYRGIIQEGNWVREGSYLREVVKKKGYDRFTGMGRIYRVYHETQRPGSQPDLMDKSADELVKYLSHPNGWWRITAQKLIVLKGDRAIVPVLKDIIEGNEGMFSRLLSPDKDAGLERLHALWTLEGLDAVDKSLLKVAYRDKDSRVRTAALRISDRFVKAKDAEILEELKAMTNDPHHEVLQQLILTFRMDNETTRPLVREILRAHPDNEVIKITAEENLNPSFSEIQMIKEKYKLRGEAAGFIVNGYKIFNEYCSSCHGRDGKGIPQLAPSLIGSPRVTGNDEVTIKILLHGLTGPVDGVEYNGPMAPIAEHDNLYIACVASYIRTHLNNAPMVGPGRVRVIRENNAERKKYWTLKELDATVAKGGSQVPRQTMR